MWLDNTPFKSENVELKKNTFYEIMALMAALKQNEIEKDLLAENSGLSDKFAITLSKYIFKGFELIQ